MQAKSILIIGNYGTGNLGDDAILAGILTDLKAIGYKGKIEITHGGKNSSEDIYAKIKKVPFVAAGIRSRFNKKRKKQSMAAIKRADMVIIGGGGLFVDAESRKAPFLWAKQAKACRELNTPYICYGQSIGPLKSIVSRWVTRKVFRNAKAVHVRDKASLKYLKRIETIVGTDPAFSWLLMQKTAQKKKKIMLISLRKWNRKTEKTWKPLLKTLKSYAKKKNLKAVIIAMDVHDEKELESFKATGLTVIKPKSALEAYTAFQTAKIAVTMRLHAGIFALAAHKPLIALSYSQKVASLTETLGVQAAFQLIKTEDISSALLIKSLKKIEKGSPSFNIESPIIQNQAFLAHALDSH